MTKFNKISSDDAEVYNDDGQFRLHIDEALSIKKYRLVDLKIPDMKRLGATGPGAAAATAMVVENLESPFLPVRDCTAEMLRKMQVRTSE